MTPLDTPIHPVSILSTTLHALFTGLSSFRLVPMSTVPNVEGLHHQKHKAAGAAHYHPHAAHITYTDTDSCSSCFMFHNSSIASFIVGAWEKQLLNFVISSSSVSSLQDRTTSCTAPVDFLKISVLKSRSLTLQVWSISSIQSSKHVCFCHQKPWWMQTLHHLPCPYWLLLACGKPLGGFFG